jgi:hypothetical protein
MAGGLSFRAERGFALCASGFLGQGMAGGLEIISGLVDRKAGLRAGQMAKRKRQMAKLRSLSDFCHLTFAV